MWFRLAIVLAISSQAEGLLAQVRFPGDSPSRPIPFQGVPFGVTQQTTSQVRGGLGFGRSTFRTTNVVGVVPGGTLLGVGPGFGGVYAGPVWGGGFVPYGYGRTFAYGGFVRGGCGFCGGFGSFCRCGPIALPPVFADAGQIFGPRAAMNFHGNVGGRVPVARNNVGPLPAVAGAGAQPARAQPPANQAPPAGMAPARPPQRIAARPVNAGPRARAWKFIDHGDRHFRAGKYRDALGRYKRAVASDAALADARFRVGFAHLGLGNVAQASLSFRRGLDRDRGWPDSAFVLDDLFADDESRDAAYETVIEQLKLMPNDAEARFVAGVMLHFDGRPDAAAKQFRRVIEIAGDDPASRLFLPDAAPENGVGFGIEAQAGAGG